jgi:hypothetical protein
MLARVSALTFPQQHSEELRQEKVILDASNQKRARDELSVDIGQHRSMHIMFTVSIGKHRPDYYKDNAYLQTNCYLLLRDADGEAYTYLGTDQRNDSVLDIIGKLRHDPLFCRAISSKRQRGMVIALHNALRKASDRFRLQRPARHSFNSDKQHQKALMQWKKNYFNQLNSWKNIKAKVWKEYFKYSAKSAQINSTIGKDRTPKPKPQKKTTPIVALPQDTILVEGKLFNVTPPPQDAANVEPKYTKEERQFLDNIRICVDKWVTDGKTWIERGEVLSKLLEITPDSPVVIPPQKEEKKDLVTT